jgi:aspartate/methionine/tyrosine aminotransferase
MKVANRLEGINEYYFSQKLREIEELNNTGPTVLNLGIGSPDTAPHEDVIAVLNEESKKPDASSYQTYKGVKALRIAIADWYQKWYSVKLDPAKEILPLVGSKEGIMHISMTYLNTGDIVLVPNPGYPTYKSAAAIAGARVIEYNLWEENNWFPDFENIEAQINEAEPLSNKSQHSNRENKKQILMWVNYPHMPTGQLPTDEMFTSLIAFAKKHHILLCHDNPYSFILNDKPMSLLAFDEKKEVVIELNSLSKSHNMAGWRIGMLCGAEKRIEEVLRFKSNMDSGMFLPLQLAAAKALTLDKHWFQRLNSLYRERRAIVYQLLDLLKCTYSKDQAGLFIWAKIPAPYENSFDLSNEILHKARVFITPGGIFGSEGNQYLRISLCSSVEKFKEAITRLKAIH